MPRPNAANNKGRRQISRRQRMGEAVREGRVENNFHPIFGYELTCLIDAETLWRLHPAIH